MSLTEGERSNRVPLCAETKAAKLTIMNAAEAARPRRTFVDEDIDFAPERGIRLVWAILALVIYWHKPLPLAPDPEHFTSHRRVAETHGEAKESRVRVNVNLDRC